MTYEAETLRWDETVRAVRRAMDDVVRSGIGFMIDDLTSRGELPLSPFEWGMREPWYRGDLT